MSTHSDAQAHGDRGAHESLNRTAFMATVHCLTGCAIGEVLGMVIGTAAGLSTVATVALSIALAFLFGYTLTSLPLLRSGMALAVVAPIALASDTISITIMEIVDNAIMVLIPGAMDAGPNPGGAISSSGAGGGRGDASGTGVRRSLRALTAAGASGHTRVEAARASRGDL
jgi:hypothetical protein